MTHRAYAVAVAALVLTGAVAASGQPRTEALVERTAADAVTIRAVRTPPLDLDGRLDEAVYASVAPLTDFVQQEPREGQPATEKTEAWILFDEQFLYVAARCWDSHPDREVANELRRDNGNILGNENITFVIDTFHDKRNGYLFQTNPLGALRDMTVTDDQQNSAWNGIWYVKTGRFEQGWTVEVAIPFKTLRYKGSGAQTWALNLRRLVKWKNEFSYLSLVPAALGTGGVSRMASAATMIDVEPPAQSKNLEIKPYVLGSATAARAAAGTLDRALDANAGFDFKYGLTRSLILDTTFRTDFAQVEEDLQQLNLTRFSLFFPEKREFFIEGQGIFDFGGVQAGNSPGDVPLLFYSRRIGLNQGLAVPVVGGARLTGRQGPYSIGLLDIHTDDSRQANAASTGFTALRLKRNIFRRSNVGVMATRRGPAAVATASSDGGDASYTIGADATLLFFKSINLTAYAAQTRNPDGRGRMVTGASYRGRLDYTDDRYGLAAEHMLVDAFLPEVGFVRRTDVRRTFAQARFSPRPRRSRIVRKLTWQASLDYLTDAAASQVQAKEQAALFRVDLQSSDNAQVDYSREYEFVPARFAVAPGVNVQAGGYDADTVRVSYGLGQQRRVSGRIGAGYGTLYGGTRSEVTYSGRWGVLPQLSIEPTLSLNWADLPVGSFAARLVSSRVTLTPSARMLVSSLVQYNVDAHTVSSSVRLRWEYTGGSELFVVYSDGRDTQPRPGQGLQNRTIAVKATRLFRF